MNKEEIRTSYVDTGHKVPPVSEWKEIGSVKREKKVKKPEKGKKVKKAEKYDVKLYEFSVTDDTKRVGTATVEVLNEGLMNTEDRNIESAKVSGIDWSATAEPFGIALRDWLLEQEITDKDIFAIAVEHIYTEDEVAHVLLYTNKGDVSNQIAKRRDDLFSLIEIK